MTETRPQQICRSLIALGLALTCAVAIAQTVILQGSGPGNVRGTPTSIQGTAIPLTSSNYCDGRFTVWSDNTNVVVDNDSSLTWTRDAHVDGTNDWTNSIAYCSNLTYAGHSDWRLPSITEFSRDGTYGATNGLVDAFPSTNDPAFPLGHPFINIQTGNGYWSSTEHRVVDMTEGGVANLPLDEMLDVWPCRGP